MFTHSFVVLLCTGFLGQAGETKKDDALAKAKDAVVKRVKDLKGDKFYQSPQGPLRSAVATSPLASQFEIA